MSIKSIFSSGDGFDMCQECWENTKEFKNSTHSTDHWIMQIPHSKPDYPQSFTIRRNFVSKNIESTDRDKLLDLVRQESLQLKKSETRAEKNNDPTQKNF